MVIVLLIIGGINTLKDDSKPVEETVQQIAETKLAESQVSAEQIGAGHKSGFAEDKLQYRNLEENNLEGYNSEDKSLSSNANSNFNNVNTINGNLTVSFLDVGQGDSIFIGYNEKTMLIDAGEKDEGAVVSEYLHNHNISDLEYVVATHPHSDHIGGMEEILNEFQVEHFIDSGFPHNSKTYENMLTTIDKKNIPFELAKKGEEIEFDPAVDVEVLNPGSEYSDELNENSIVLKVSYGEVSFLLMGDAGLETEGKLMDTGYNLESEILKVGHHASRSGSGESSISKVNPEISVIEVGEGNDYGHPHAEILERLQKTSSVYRTDLDGTIVVTTDGTSYTVTTEKTGSEEEKGKAAKTESTENKVEGSAASVGNKEVETQETKIKETEKQQNSGPTSAESTVYLSDLSLQDEWVEISNKGNSPVSLKGWEIKDEGSKHTFAFPSYTLDSQAAVILYTGKGTDTAKEIFWGSGNPIWNNDGDSAYLYDDSGKLIATLER